MSKSAVRNTRKSKIASEKAPTNTKYIEENSTKLQEKFTPTPAQKTLINKIRENTLVFCDSEAGTGKTSATLFEFCREYIADPYKQIVIVRTPVEIGGDKVGFLPSTLSDKLAIHFASTREILEKFLGKGRVEADLDKRIHFKIPNYMLGSTIHNSLVLIDEAQQLQPMILKLLLERTGRDSKVVIAGCSNQLYSTGKDRNALADAIQRFFVIKDGEYFPRYDGVDYHEFDIEDIQRSEIVKTVIKAYKGVGGF
jgi:phosphate starvation-inducible PhoH-like protein